jgi:trehalose/maltose hydrolase-like predicted phosphorylase
VTVRDEASAPRLHRTFEAVLFTWHAATVPDRTAARGLRGQVEALCDTGAYVVVLVEADADDTDQHVASWSCAPGNLLVCTIGGGGPHRAHGDQIASVDTAGAMLAVLARLGRRGLGPGLVLVIGDRFGAVDAAAGSDAPLLVAEAARACVVSVGTEPAGAPAGVRHLGGGPPMVRRLLDEQVRRRRQRRVPAIDDDPAWTISDDGRDPLRHRVTETLFTLGAGGLATRGSVEEAPEGSVPLVLAAGAYTGVGTDQHLLPGPDWTRLSIDPPPADGRRVLDLRNGLLWREGADGADDPPLYTLRFASVARPGVVALRAEGPVGRLRPGPSLQLPGEGRTESGRLTGRSWARVLAADTTGVDPAPAAGIAAVAAEQTGRHERLRVLERITALASSWEKAPEPEDTVAALEAAVECGFDRMLAEHRAAWAGRWEAVDVSIPDDPAAQLAVRFALFQLWNNVDRSGEVAVGARGLSGTGYRGHVFWDADCYVLPAIASMSPQVARAMVEYRLRRLPAAQTEARVSRRAGARFPWESAADGRDVTPAYGDVGGQVVPILTGRMEEHITADVAWAACHYASWAGDAEFLPGPGRALLMETARYWASRCRLDDEGHAHIDNVIGPDEYHEAVNDNAYTNVMARWNLRRAADLVDATEGSIEETHRWRDIADRLVDGYRPATGRYEQFVGYHQLEPLLVADIGRPPLAADVLLGRERVAASQMIKQPDVMMLHHLVPDEVEPGSLVPNLEFYEPRTSHGSSLSPAIMAALLARAGRPDDALQLLRIALFLDLDDLTGMTASGLHVATMGGVWQAMLTGFAGVRVRDGVLGVDPVLPTDWPRLGLRFRCLGRQVRLDLTHEVVEIGVDGPLLVDVSGRGPQMITDAARFADVFATRSGLAG